MGMGLDACPLCFYQRACVLGVTGIIFVGLLLREPSESSVAIMALPVAIAALGVGIMHCYLEYTGKLECPKGIADYGSAPQQALAAEAILVFFLLIGGRARIGAMLFAILLGAGSAWLMLNSVPKPKVPTEPYKGPPTICRVPYEEKK